MNVTLNFELITCFACSLVVTFTMIKLIKLSWSSALIYSNKTIPVKIPSYIHYLQKNVLNYICSLP